MSEPSEPQGPGVPEHGVTKPPRVEPAPPRRVMSIHAHPDDQEFTVGGTLAKWARAGSEIVTVCITRGAGGSNRFTPPEMTRAALATIREAEQRRACQVLGIATVHFLDYEDGTLEATIGLRRDLARLVRRHRPDAVVCGDPTVRYYGSTYLNHPDHRAAADAALDAVFPSAGTRLIFPELLAEGLEPHEVREIYIHGAERPDTWVDIAETLELKIAALREHKSQMGEWDPAEFLVDWAREQGARAKLPAAEAYRRMILEGP
ncbi:MAG TPA: PIG-L deacetylase family protein [Methylomirabilota bacterium]|nr:PIG-L deacetylase family protein [Methylomirabilota bacterium]